MRVSWADIQLMAASVCTGACLALTWNLFFTHPSWHAWFVQSVLLVAAATFGVITGMRIKKDDA